MKKIIIIWVLLMVVVLKSQGQGIKELIKTDSLVYSCVETSIQTFNLKDSIAFYAFDMRIDLERDEHGMAKIKGIKYSNDSLGSKILINVWKRMVRDINFNVYLNQKEPIYHIIVPVYLIMGNYFGYTGSPEFSFVEIVNAFKINPNMISGLTQRYHVLFYKVFRLGSKVVYVHHTPAETPQKDYVVMEHPLF